MSVISVVIVVTACSHDARGAHRLTAATRAATTSTLTATATTARPRPTVTTLTPTPAPTPATEPPPPYWQSISPPTGPESFSITTGDGTLATHDSGTTWLRARADRPLDHVWNVAAPTPGVLFAIKQWVSDGSSAHVVRSVDGGRTWLDVAAAGRVYHAGDYADLGFSDRRNGWIVTAEPVGNGEADVVRTFDGGRTWAPVLRGNFPGWEQSGLPGDAHAEFLGASVGFAVGVMPAVAPAPLHAVLVRTTDAGRTWRTVVSTQLDDNWTADWDFDQGAMSLPYFSTTTTAYVATVGRIGDATGASGVGGAWHVAVLRSTDAGVRWTPRAHIDVRATDAPQVLFVDSRHWIVLNGGEHTDDGGRTWHREWSPAVRWPAVAQSGRVYAIDDNNHLWVRSRRGTWADVPPGALPPD